MTNELECPNNPWCLTCAAKVWREDGAEKHGAYKCVPSELNTRNKNGRYRGGRPDECKPSTVEVTQIPHRNPTQTLLSQHLANLKRE